jgi:hypothetical protein
MGILYFWGGTSPRLLGRIVLLCLWSIRQFPVTMRFPMAKTCWSYVLSLFVSSVEVRRSMMAAKWRSYLACPMKVKLGCKFNCVLDGKLVCEACCIEIRFDWPEEEDEVAAFYILADGSIGDCSSVYAMKIGEDLIDRTFPHRSNESGKT